MRSPVSSASRPRRAKARTRRGAEARTASWAMGAAGTDKVEVAVVEAGAQRPLAPEVHTPTDACQRSWWPAGGVCSL